MNGRYKSLDGNKHAQIFANESFFASTYPGGGHRSGDPKAMVPHHVKEEGPKAALGLWCQVGM